VRQRCLDHQADAGAGEQQIEAKQHADRYQHHEPAVGRVLGGEQREEGEIQLGRNAVVDRRPAPDEVHHFLDHVGEAEREQQLGDVAELVHCPQSEALGQCSEHAHEQGRQEQGGPETGMQPGLVGEIGAEHVEACMREVEHAHHAEDQRQSGREHEQQQSVGQAVQQGDEEELHVRRR
jgi:hypothetical protein